MGRVRVALAMFLCASIASTAYAQRRAFPVKRLGILPPSTARLTPQSIIVVAFDRPLVESIENATDPARFVRVTPALPVQFEWRDPSTIRIVPLRPLVSGSTYVVRVDTTVVATDGAKLGRVHRQEYRVGNVQLRRIEPGFSIRTMTTLPVSGRVQLVVSAPVDTSFGRSIAVTIDSTGGCTPRRYRYRLSRSAGDRYIDPVRDVFARGGRTDTLVQRLDYEPVDSIPYGCRGVIELPDATGGNAQYRVATAAPFTLNDQCLVLDECARTTGVILRFTNAVSRSQLLAHLRLEPASSFVLDSVVGQRDTWSVRAQLAYRSMFKVVIDSSMRDVDGRRYSGPSLIVGEVADATPTIVQSIGHVIMPRAVVQTLHVRYVNVDSVRIVAVRVIDSVAFAGLPLIRNADDMRKIPGLRYQHVVAVQSEFNVESSADVPLPRELNDSSTGFWMVRVFIEKEKSAPREARGDNRTAADGFAPPAQFVPVRESAAFRPAIMQFSDLAVHARVGGAVPAVFVTRARDGSSVSGARVTLRGRLFQLVGSGITDATGVLRRFANVGAFENSPGATSYVQVAAGDDQVVLPTAYVAFGMPAPLPSFRPAYAGVHTFATERIALWSDRSLYRPGDVVHIGALYRDIGLTHDVSTRTDSVRILMRRGDETSTARAHSAIVPLSTAGMLSDSLTLPADERPGFSRIEAQLFRNGAWRTIAGSMVTIAEFRLPELQVSIDNTDESVIAGDSAQFLVRARYLDGSVMAGAKVNSALETSRYWYRAPLSLSLPPDFHVGEQHRATGGGFRHDVATTLLDSSGAASIGFFATPDSTSGPTAVTFTATVTAPSRQQSTQSTTLVIHPASFYIATRQPRGPVRARDTVNIAVLAVSATGRREAGRNIEAKLVRIRTTERGDSTIVSYDTLSTAHVLTTDTISYVTVRPPDAGQYLVLLRSADDKQRVIRTSSLFAASNRASPPAAAPIDNSALLITLSDTLAAIGDTVTLRYTSPFAHAEAWITIERNGVLRDVRAGVGRGDHVLRLPVLREDAPNVYIGVTLVASGTDWCETNSVSERVRHGYARLAVDMSSRKLAVQVRARKNVMRPSDSAFIDISARDARGRPVQGEAIVWAVDKASMELAPYNAPNPFLEFHGTIMPVTTFWTSATMALGRASEIRDAFGRFSLGPITTMAPQTPLVERGQVGSGDTISADRMTSLPVSSLTGVLNLADGLMRINFRSTAFFRARVRLDASGTARFAQRLPDNITSYRLYAVVADSTDRFGSGESEFTVTQALVLRAALPRFLRAGDSMYAGGFVNIRSGTPRDVLVTVTTPTLQIFGDSVKPATAMTAPSEVRFAMRVPDSAVARIDLRAANVDEFDGESRLLPIKPVMQPRVFASVGTVRSVSHVRIALPGGTDPMKSTLTIRVGSSLLPLLHLIGEQSIHYGYDCSEQLASNIRVQVQLLSLARDHRDVGMDSVLLRSAIAKSVGQLAQRVGADGGVDYWPGIRWDVRWLSTYAGVALLEAHAAGFDVDPALTNRIGAFLARNIPREITRYGTALERRTRTEEVLGDELLRAWLATRAGKPEAELLTHLMTRRATLVWEDRALLAEVLADNKRQEEARLVLTELWGTVRPLGVAVDVPDSRSTSGFPSTMRGPARLLSATLAAWPEHPMLPRLVERMVQRGRAANGFYWNTQDYGWLVPSIATWVRHSPDRESIVRVSGTDASHPMTLTATSSRLADSTLSISSYAQRSGDSVVVSLTLRNTGAPVFYTATVLHSARERELTAEGNGFTVERWIERLSDGKAITEVDEGELVRVRLRITARNIRDFVALEDWLPAGLEVNDPSLRNSSSLAAILDASAEAASRRASDDMNNESGDTQESMRWFGPWEYRDFHDDRVRWFARSLPKGTHTVSYVARATTAGKFVRPAAHAEEMYNQAVNARSEAGWLTVRSK